MNIEYDRNFESAYLTVWLKTTNRYFPIVVFVFRNFAPY